jgi:hypothetical protein
MEPAFLQFSEPYAWLIRGLIEYGWEDLSLKPQMEKRVYFYTVWHLTLMKDGFNKTNPTPLF